MRRGVVIGGAVALVLAAVGGWALSHGAKLPGGISESTELPLSVSAEVNAANTVISIVGKSPSPVTITRVVANDRDGVYECDRSEAMSGKGETFTDPDGKPDKNTSGDFTPKALKTGEELTLGFWFKDCGDRIVKIHIETDQGSQDFEFDR